MARALGAFKNRALFAAWRMWRENVEDANETRDKLRVAAMRFVNRALAGAFGQWASYAEDMEISATEEAMVKVAHGDIANKATAGLAKHLDLDLDPANGNECVRAFFFKSGHSWQDTPVECEVTAGTDAFNACAFPAMSITVTFENKRGDPVTLFWENPDDGEAIQSGDPVAPGKFVSKNTFPTHTFLIRSVVAPSSAKIALASGTNYRTVPIGSCLLCTS